MPVTQKFALVPMDRIIVEDRGRKKLGDISALADSIARYGLLNPITISRDGKLKAGERRFRAAQKLKWTQIPAQVFEELDVYDAKAVELEENVRRLDLDWREEADMVLDYHNLRASRDSEWTIEQTGDALGYERSAAQRRVTVARAIREEPKKFESFDGLAAAYNFLSREHQRAMDKEAEEFLADPDAYLSGELDDIPVAKPPKKELSPAQIANIYRGIYNSSFQEWLEKDWKGQRFTVLHCDFPYGIYHHESDQASSERKEGAYEDTPEIFWELCRVLADGFGDLLENNSHVIFWYASHMYSEVSEYFTGAGFTVDPVPLIWLKSDSTGILPDPNRGPRRIYETALLMTKGDRFIVRAVNNAIAHPANRTNAKHPSEKPLEVVTHFLKMLIDQHTLFLDPTCGSGTAVAAAETLGAKDVYGVELDRDHAQTARGLINRIRLAKVDHE